MIGSVYIFVKKDGVLSQNPNDYSREIFEHFVAVSTAPTQVVTHRAGKVMYYGYIRRLTNEDCIGFCILVNGVFFDSLYPLFKLFEQAIERLVTRGEILRYNEKAELELIESDLPKIPDKCERVCKELYKLEDDTHSFHTLPPELMSVGRDELVTHSISESQTTVVKDTTRYGYTLITKQSGFDTESMRNKRNEIRKKKVRLDKEKARNRKRVLRKFVLSVLTILSLVVAVKYIVDNINQKSEEQVSTILQGRYYLIGVIKKKIGPVKLIGHLNFIDDKVSGEYRHYGNVNVIKISGYCDTYANDGKMYFVAKGYLADTGFQCGTYKGYRIGKIIKGKFTNSKGTRYDFTLVLLTEKDIKEIKESRHKEETDD